jgi:hypothetical protein
VNDELCVRESGVRRLQCESSPALDAFDEMERELIRIFDDVLHSDYPNPERIGCPGTDVLYKLAISPEKFACQSTLRHLARCAPCVDELKQLRLRAKAHQADCSH